MGVTRGDELTGDVDVVIQPFIHENLGVYGERREVDRIEDCDRRPIKTDRRSSVLLHRGKPGPRTPTPCVAP